ncbi:TatD family hydrolase [Arcanobacterium hippocoleae]|uniref:TatD family hydrolase n=1 Tax=Arcanobacterium hippocoleae TaxID=149017 RepID=UPI0033426FED
MGKNKKRYLPLLPERPLSVPIIDNHTHISADPAPASGGELQQRYDPEGRILMPVLERTLLARMADAGVRGAITSGCEIPEFAHTLELAKRVPNIWAAIAIHPNEAAMHAGISAASPDGLTHEFAVHHREFSLDDAIAQVAQIAQEPEVVAVGETGLDYFRTGEAGKAAQKESFRAHLQLAKELGKPMQIHDRDAHADVVEILQRDGAPEKTVFHCFSGDVKLAEICAENGWYASFAGPITYPVNTQLQHAFDSLPDELILIETDAPYLTPYRIGGIQMLSGGVFILPDLWRNSAGIRWKNGVRS